MCFKARYITPEAPPYPRVRKMANNTYVGNKNPARAEARESGLGFGVTPSHNFTYKKSYRQSIKSDGITYPIAICLTCGKIIEPVRREFSRTTAHGTFYYEHEHPLEFITLVQSNSGKRYAEYRRELPLELRGKVAGAWLRGKNIHEIEHIITETLKELKGERKW